MCDIISGISQASKLRASIRVVSGSKIDWVTSCPEEYRGILQSVHMNALKRATTASLKIISTSEVLAEHFILNDNLPHSNRPPVSKFKVLPDWLELVNKVM
jgi:hypothetical protein